MKPPVRERRAALGGAAVLSVTAAAELLPFGQARRWLHDQGLVRTVRRGGSTVEVVIWGDVLDALRGQAEQPAPKQARRRPKLAVLE